MDFCHLHCHTQYSLLDGACEIGAMMDKAVHNGQKGIALTDHGNLYGAFKFVAEANKRNIKPIVGCEFYLVNDRHKKNFSRSNNERDVRYHQLLIAKNALGYQNLSKLCSLGFIEGLYGKFPRIDKELLLQYHEGLIATSCCIGAELPQTIIHKGEEKAEELLKWWLDLFGEDYYIELQRHRGLDNIDGTGVSQEQVNQTLLRLAKKYNIKVIATNDAHYIDEDDWKPHDILLCVNTNQKIFEEKRFRFSSSDYYLKTKEEMTKLFADVPQAIDYTMEVFDKVDTLQLKRDVLLPNFPLPQGFKSQFDYLKHLVYQGAKERYGEISAEVQDRLELELGIISNMNFNGYFLIVQDFIQAARQMGVVVGPGRGSAAGSAVAYCLKITNIDPLKYQLLFERFLNPERISMPDIDIDFDDSGRQKVIDWVIDKYGKQQVAQIITFGTMAARSSVRDVGRVLDLPLNDTDRIAKLIPDKPGTKLKSIFGKSENDLAQDWKAEDYENIIKLHQISKKEDKEAETINLAQRLEGSVRHTGIHAAGVIIAPDDITKFIPVAKVKDSELLVTQFEGSLVEKAGMLKMDFLGLKTLSILKDAIDLIVLRHGEKARIHLDEIPLDDEPTIKLFQRGDMIGIFQFESIGMQKHLKNLKPTNLEDLIAMTALYRPGPMDNIPLFIDRKHGKIPTDYPHPWLEDILKPTYGIMVYQEQIMQAAQIMADYSLAKADMLRRAMGKKDETEMKKHEEIFVQGAMHKGVDTQTAKNIFKTMAKFASYGFNRSHAAAYSVISFQTAYLKTHYPAEFMASVLTHNKNDVETLNFFLRECKRMGIKVLPPDVNESFVNFTVNQKGHIRFGLSALKGIGKAPCQEIIRARTDEGLFEDIYDFFRKVNTRFVNKSAIESLAYGCAFDNITKNITRAQLFAATGRYNSFLEQLARYGSYIREQALTKQASLFGDALSEDIPEPTPPQADEWPLNTKLAMEKKVSGIFLSGHPLDPYDRFIRHFTNADVQKIQKLVDEKKISENTKLKMAFFIAQAQHRISKKGTGYGIFTLQDYHSQIEVRLFKEDYQDFKGRLEPGQSVYVEGFYRKKWSGDGHELKISKVQSLETAVEELLSGLVIRIDIHNMDKHLINALDDILKKYKGKQRLRFVLVDTKNEIDLKLLSKKTIALDDELISEIERLGVSTEVA